MSSPFDQATKLIQQRQNDERWSKLTLTGWRYGKAVIAFYLFTAIVLPLAVWLLIWGIPS